MRSKEAFEAFSERFLRSLHWRNISGPWLRTLRSNFARSSQLEPAQWCDVWHDACDAARALRTRFSNERKIWTSKIHKKKMNHMVSFPLCASSLEATWKRALLGLPLGAKCSWIGWIECAWMQFELKSRNRGKRKSHTNHVESLAITLKRLFASITLPSRCQH